MNTMIKSLKTSPSSSSHVKKTERCWKISREHPNLQHHTEEPSCEMNGELRNFQQWIFLLFFIFNRYFSSFSPPSSRSILHSCKIYNFNSLAASTIYTYRVRKILEKCFSTVVESAVAAAKVYKIRKSISTLNSSSRALCSYIRCMLLVKMWNILIALKLLGCR